MSKLVYGAGINDRSRPTRVDGKQVKEYVLWFNMLNRCFSEKYQNKYPTYKDCFVSDNFLNYSFFYDWCQEQIGFGNIDENGKTWCLDKDILFTGNKVYGENTCVFVPQEINKFFTDRGNDRGDYPIGVYFCKSAGKFRADCTGNGVGRYLGYFETTQEASLKYKSVKESLCKHLALKWQSEIDTRLFTAMMKWEVNYETPSTI